MPRTSIRATALSHSKAHAHIVLNALGRDICQEKEENSLASILDPGVLLPCRKQFPDLGKSDPSAPRGIVCGVLIFSSEQTSAQDTEPSLAPSSPIAFVCLCAQNNPVCDGAVPYGQNEGNNGVYSQPAKDPGP